jgi:poly-gamma-glutamate capsule biosynthesis protein CapA/YwtB (metallophosphatase superfamily)
MLGRMTADTRWLRAIRTGAVSIITAWLVTLVLSSAKAGAGGAADGKLTLFLAGDTIITQPWPKAGDQRFQTLVDQIRGTDVAAVNLEMLFHDYRGYAQADSGGGYVAARPAIAADLAWVGIDMVANANNHTFDYGSQGVLENSDNVALAGLVLAGSGKDLQAARAPVYFAHPDGTVALVATASTFTPYGRASRSHPDLHGRPGLNPLATEPGRFLGLPPSTMHAVWGVAEFLDLPRRRLDENHFEVFGARMRGRSVGLRRGRVIDRKDLEGNLASVREAAAKADVVVFSVHAHDQKGGWLAELAHRAIDAGADVFFAHGPHHMEGIEIYKGKPVIYGPGNFVFQPEQAERFPAETYEAYGLGDDATPEDVRAAAEASKWYFHRREPWEAFAAVLRFEEGALREVRLLPLDLGFDGPLAVRGMPRSGDAELGRRIIGNVSDSSRKYGTTIRYLETENVGIVDLQ